MLAGTRRCHPGEAASLRALWGNTLSPGELGGLLRCPEVVAVAQGAGIGLESDHFGREVSTCQPP